MSSIRVEELVQILWYEKQRWPLTCVIITIITCTVRNYLLRSHLSMHPLRRSVQILTEERIFLGATQSTSQVCLLATPLCGHGECAKTTDLLKNHSANSCEYVHQLVKANCLVFDKESKVFCNLGKCVVHSENMVPEKFIEWTVAMRSQKCTHPHVPTRQNITCNWSNSEKWCTSLICSGWLDALGRQKLRQIYNAYWQAQFDCSRSVRINTFWVLLLERTPLCSY